MLDIIVIIIVIAIVSLVDFSFMFLDNNLIGLLYIDDSIQENETVVDEMEKSKQDAKDKTSLKTKSSESLDQTNNSATNEFIDEFVEGDEFAEANTATTKLDQKVINELEDVIQETIGSSNKNTSSMPKMTQEELNKQSEELERLVMEEML